MASAIYFAPEQRTGLVVLFNGQSVVYELLHKPEAIAEAAFARMIGEFPAARWWGFTRSSPWRRYCSWGSCFDPSPALCGRRRVASPSFVQPGEPRWLGTALTIWGRLMLPDAGPVDGAGDVGGPVEILVQIDLGQVLAAYAALQLLTFSVVAATVVARQARRLGGPAPERLLEARRLAG